MNSINLFKSLFSTSSQVNNKEVTDFIINKQQIDKLLEENHKLMREKTKLQQVVKIQQQENEAENEALYSELLDIFDSLEFLINYLDSNLEEENFNPKAFKRLPKFVSSMQEKLLTILSRREVEKIDFNGDIPDFSVCKVVDREIREDIPEQSITKVVRQGFKIKEKVLRYVELITAKASETP